MGFAEIEASGLEAWLAGLREDFEDGPPRSGAADPETGGERPLGIPVLGLDQA
jgi:hypothetical protein